MRVRHLSSWVKQEDWAKKADQRTPLPLWEEPGEACPQPQTLAAPTPPPPTRGGEFPLFPLSLHSPLSQLSQLSAPSRLSPRSLSSRLRRFALGLLFAILLTTGATAQQRVLHIGLRQDPDLLDPTLGSSYVGRIVFAGLCDKLFDIDAKLNIIPVLATGYQWQDPTHLLIHIRPGVLFQDGEKLDADAVKYKLMRDLTIKGSMRRGEVNSIEINRHHRPADRAAEPKGAGRPVAGAAHRPRRDHDITEGGGSGGGQIRPAPRLRRSIQFRSLASHRTASC